MNKDETKIIEDLENEAKTLKEKISKSRASDCDASLENLCNELSRLPKLKIKSRVKLKGHIAKVYAICWSECCEQLLSASQDSTLIVWNTITRSKLKAIELNCAWTMTCAFSPTNEFAATGGMDNAISVYDLHENDVRGRLVREIVGHDGFISGVKFVNNKELISSSSDHTCALWDVNTGQQVHVFKGHLSEIYCVALNKTKTLMGTGSADRSVKIWDLRMEKCHMTFFDIHDTDVNCVAFFPNGDALATASDDCKSHLIDLRARQIIATYSSPSYDDKTDTTVPLTSVAFSYSGRLLFAGCDNFNVNIWDTFRQCSLDQLHGHESRIQCIDISRKGDALASGSWDSSIRIWN